MAFMSVTINCPGSGHSSGQPRHNSAQGLDAEADGVNCSLGNFRQLMMIELSWEIFKSEKYFDNP